jgi:hypothetical protein
VYIYIILTIIIIIIIVVVSCHRPLLPGTSLEPAVTPSGVPRGGGFQTPSPRNSEVFTKLSRIPSSVENTSVSTSECGFHSFEN